MMLYSWSGLAALLLTLPVTGGCAGGPEAAMEKLGRVGLETLGEDEAAIPRKERGRYIPCRVIPGRADAALEDHPAGYLLVAVADRGEAGRGSAAVLAALGTWAEGEDLVLVIRRNPWLDSGSEWWERNVRLRLPAAGRPPATAPPKGPTKAPAPRPPDRPR